MKRIFKHVPWVVGLLALFGTAQAEALRPNIILIFVDDLGYGVMPVTVTRRSRFQTLTECLKKDNGGRASALQVPPVFRAERDQ
jgi:hypothetical protein